MFIIEFMAWGAVLGIVYYLIQPSQHYEIGTIIFIL